jgi:hypothetical protein
MRALHVTRHFYWVSVMMKILPDAAVKLLAPDFSGVIELKNESPTCNAFSENLLTTRRAFKQKSVTCYHTRASIVQK